MALGPRLIHRSWLESLEIRYQPMAERLLVVIRLQRDDQEELRDIGRSDEADRGSSSNEFQLNKTEASKVIQ